MNKKVSLAIVGGFLGAGKTTSILALAKKLTRVGKKLGIVTNDQGSSLVDTNYLAAEGMSVLEVTGGCFCCNFDEFTRRVSELAESSMPDIILAEPVGSCTDLVATIYKPLQSELTRQFTLRPLSVVVDPRRVGRLMMETGNSPFPDEINYLFRKQLEEADIIVLNKIDTLAQAEIAEITAFLEKTFRGREILAVSAKNGQGIDQWIDRITSGEASLSNTLDIDYETYAKAEAGMGWLNSSVLLQSESGFNANLFVIDFMEALKASLIIQNSEIAHLKIYAVSENDWAKASITSIFEKPEFNRNMENPVRSVNLIVNARINISPETLKPLVENTLMQQCGRNGIIANGLHTECFSPSKPVPKHRMK